jgi:hypothetical protein
MAADLYDHYKTRPPGQPKNGVAVSLYTGPGFRPIRRLVGYNYHPHDARDHGSDFERMCEIDPLIVARLIAKDGEPDLPWMLMPETLAAATPPVQAFHLDEIAYAIVADILTLKRL